MFKSEKLRDSKYYSLSENSLMVLLISSKVLQMLCLLFLFFHVALCHFASLVRNYLKCLV